MSESHCFPRTSYRWPVGERQSGGWKTEYFQTSRPKMKGETKSIDIFKAPCLVWACTSPHLTRTESYHENLPAEIPILPYRQRELFCGKPHYRVSRSFLLLEDRRFCSLLPRIMVTVNAEGPHGGSKHGSLDTTK